MGDGMAGMMFEKRSPSSFSFIISSQVPEKACGKRGGAGVRGINLQDPTVGLDRLGTCALVLKGAATESL